MSELARLKLLRRLCQEDCRCSRLLLTINARRSRNLQRCECTEYAHSVPSGLYRGNTRRTSIATVPKRKKWAAHHVHRLRFRTKELGFGPQNERLQVKSLQLLKQEIVQTMESEHDFAKWKLIVVAALGGTAMGLGKETPRYWLLLFIPFLCAYIDLHSYQYQNRIMVLARFIRDYHPAHPVREDDATLHAYEGLCHRFRR